MRMHTVTAQLPHKMGTRKQNKTKNDRKRGGPEEVIMRSEVEEESCEEEE